MDNIVNAKGTDLPPSRQPPLPPPSPMQQQSQKVISQVSNPLNQKSAIKKELENIQQQSLVQKSVDRFNAKAIVGRKPSTSAPCLPTAKSLIPADKPRIEITAVSAPQISAANPGNNLPLNTRKRWFDDIPDEVLRERIISSMTKEQKLRQEVSFELLVTEGYYLRDLSTLLDTYGKPLRTNRKGQRWPELEELFSHIEQLMPVNQVLLDELKKCRRGFVMNAMGEAFLVVADYLKIYTGYCGMQNKTVDYIQRLHKQDSTFKAILKDIYTSPLFIGQNFESYLIKPVQRICKYPLLIRELIKSTPVTHRDWAALDKARQKIEEIVKTVNERTRKLEDMSRTLAIYQKIKHGNDLITPTRYFIHDGAAIVGGKKCHMFLFNDMLLLCKHSSLIAGEKYSVYQQVLFELGVHLLDMSGSEAFVLVQACADEIITVIAMQSVDEKQRWVAEFEKVDVCMQGDIGGDSRLRLIKDFSRSSSSTIRLEATHSESKSDGISSIDSAPSLHQSSRSIN